MASTGLFGEEDIDNRRSNYGSYNCHHSFVPSWSYWKVLISIRRSSTKKNWNMHIPANVRCWSAPGREILISSVCLMNRGLCVRVHKLSKQHAQSVHIWILRKNKAKQLWKLNYHRQRQDESFNDSNHGLNCA